MDINRYPDLRLFFDDLFKIASSLLFPLLSTSLHSTFPEKFRDAFSAFNMIPIIEIKALLLGET